MFTNTRKMVVFLSLVCLGMSSVAKASTCPILKVAGTPLNNLSFEVSVIRSKAVVLSWESATAGNAYYEVEQSFDNTNFKTVGLVLDGFDIQNSDKKSYKFKDDNVMAFKDKKIVYYRLKQIDPNGVVANSDVMIVKLDN
jgi:hypothetical protein